MALAKNDEPLILADGTRIDPSTGKPERNRRVVEVPRYSDAVKQVTATRRKLADLPAPPKEMNALSLVCSYSIMGLSDHDIALALGLTVDQVGRIRMNDAYKQVHETIVSSIVDQDAQDVRALIAAHSRNAVATVVDKLESGNDAVALSAANSILDRAGHRPADIVEHRHRMEGGLVIEIVEKSNESAPPEIDVDFEEM